MSQRGPSLASLKHLGYQETLSKDEQMPMLHPPEKAKVQPKELQTEQLPFCPRENRDMGFLGTHTGHKKEVNGSNQHGFVKGKSCMTREIAFYGKLTEYLEEVRTVHLIFLDFCKIFNSISTDILVSRFGQNRLLEN